MNTESIINEIHGLDDEYGTGRVTLGAFLPLLARVDETNATIGQTNGAVGDLEPILLEIRDAIVATHPLLTRIAVATESIDAKPKGPKK